MFLQPEYHYLTLEKKGIKMKKAIFILLLLSSHIMLADNWILNKPAKYGYWSGFNLKANENDLTLNKHTKIGLPNEIPSIGYYDPKGYPMADNIIYIKLEPWMLETIVPQSLKKALQIQSFYTTNKQIFAYIVFSRSLAPNHMIENLVFHSFASLFSGSGYFNTNVLMGIFDPRGVQAAGQSSVSINTIKPTNVNFHGPEVMLSPNNARFTIQPNRGISTFWSAASNPNGGTPAAITFNVLINDDAIRNKFDNALQKSNTFNDFLTQLRVLIDDNITNNNDKSTAENVLTILQNIAKSPEAKVTAPLYTELTSLQNQLTQLETSLSQLAQ